MNLALTAQDARFLRALLDGYRTTRAAPWAALRNQRGRVVIHAKPLPPDVAADVARATALIKPIDDYLAGLPPGI